MPHHLDNEISGLFQDFSGNIPFFSRLLQINFQDFSSCLINEPTMRDTDFALVMVGDADFGLVMHEKSNMVFSRFLSDFQSFCTKIFGCFSLSDKDKIYFSHGTTSRDINVYAYRACHPPHFFCLFFRTLTYFCCHLYYINARRTNDTRIPHILSRARR